MGRIIDSSSVFRGHHDFCNSYRHKTLVLGFFLVAFHLCFTVEGKRGKLLVEIINCSLNLLRVDLTLTFSKSFDLQPLSGLEERRQVILWNVHLSRVHEFQD